MTGVVTISNGRITGGDTNYYYSGTYRIDNARKAIYGDLRVVHFFGPLMNLFGPVRDISLSFSGAVGSDLIIASARSPGVAYLEIQIRLERVERF